jgi:hypothetical protein
MTPTTTTVQYALRAMRTEHTIREQRLAGQPITVIDTDAWQAGDIVMHHDKLYCVDHFREGAVITPATRWQVLRYRLAGFGHRCLNIRFRLTENNMLCED